MALATALVTRPLESSLLRFRAVRGRPLGDLLAFLQSFVRVGSHRCINVKETTIGPKSTLALPCVTFAGTILLIDLAAVDLATSR